MFKIISKYSTLEFKTWILISTDVASTENEKLILVLHVTLSAVCLQHSFTTVSPNSSKYNVVL